MSPFCLFLISGALCFWGRFQSCSSSSFSSCMLWGPVSSGMRSSGEVREEQHRGWVGLSLFCVLCNWRAAIGKGKGLSATPFLGAGGRKCDLECCRDGHGKEVINWESFKEISSKLLRFSGIRYMCLQTHMEPPPLYQTRPWCWQRKCPGRKMVHGAWTSEDTYKQWGLPGWLKCGTCGFSIFWQASTLYSCLLEAEGPLEVPVTPPKAEETPVRSSLGVLECQTLAVHHT